MIGPDSDRNPTTPGPCTACTDVGKLFKPRTITVHRRAAAPPSLQLAIIPHIFGTGEGGEVNSSPARKLDHEATLPVRREDLPSEDQG